MISNVGLSNVSSNGGQTSAAQNDVMGKDDFLHLLVAQLQAQDPLNPMDSTGFTAQLAQFSSLEQLQNINSGLTALQGAQTSANNAQAVGFIGKTVTAVGQHFGVSQGSVDAMQFDLKGDAAAVYAKVYDNVGNFVADVQSGPMTAGHQQMIWDGLDLNGNTAADGQYSFEIMAVDDAGDMVPSTTYTSGTVTGVTFKNGLAYLVSDGQEIALSSVTQVLEPNP